MYFLCARSVINSVLPCARNQEKNKSAHEAKIKKGKTKEIKTMKNIENVKELNELELKEVTGGRDATPRIFPG